MLNAIRLTVMFPSEEWTRQDLQVLSRCELDTYVLSLRWGFHSALLLEASVVVGKIVVSGVHDSDNDSSHLLAKVISISEMENVVVVGGLAAEYPLASRPELARA
jgi:hypothetical protein